MALHPASINPYTKEAPLEIRKPTGLRGYLSLQLSSSQRVESQTTTPSQPEPPDIRTSQHVCLWLSPLHNCSTWSSVTRRLSRVVPKIPDVWFPSLSQVLKVVQSQTVSSFSRWPLATTLWNVVTNKHKCFTVTNLPVVLKALQKYVLVQSLELPGHLYQRHLDYLEDMVSALKPYFKIEKGIFL